jgi:D-amino peptidase
VPTALLIADLEGVAGVDALEDLIAGAPGYARACTLLAGEVRAAVHGLTANGFDRVIVSDSHRAGAGRANLRAADLPPGAELDLRPDAYAAALFARADAVAAVGMHAAAGTSGFAAHTVTVMSSWLLGGRSLSEADLVLALAAEQGVPVVFVAGDDVLARELDVPTVVAKQSLGRDAARSRPPAEVHADLAAAATRAPARVRPAEGDLVLELRSRWQADLAEGQGAARVGPYAVRLDGPTFRARYAAGLRVLEALAAPLRQQVRSCADLLALLLRRPEHAPPPSYRAHADRALAAFLDRTRGPASWQRADRALTLHMLETYAPRFFAEAELAAVLGAARAALADVPRALAPDLTPPEAMARVDAAYLAGGDLDPAELAACLGRLHPLYAWLLCEIARQLGAAVPDLPPFRPRSRVEDLYLETHRILLETRYLRRPLPTWPPVERLVLAAPWVRAGRHVDLAAELCFCMQAAGEAACSEHADLIALVAAHQGEGGLVSDPSAAAAPAWDRPRLEAHATAAALVAFAGVSSS